MNIVILNKRPLKRMRYHELFPNARIHLLTATNHTAQEEIDAVKKDYASITSYEHYDGNSAIEARVMEIGSKDKIDRIIALSEQDILRAARMRDLLSIEGMRYAEALSFRDKVVMKQKMQDAGVAVPAFAKLEHASDAYFFAAKHSYPLVLKPSRGAGSMGVSVIHNYQELEQSLDKHFTSDFDRETGYMIESFVSGDMYHIDGLVHHGEVIFARASKYINTCLSFQDGAFLGSSMLDSRSLITNKLNQVCVQAMDALGAKSSFAFHAEVFCRSENQELLVCEIACRAGGGPIVDTLIAATDIDLTQAAALLEVAADGVLDKISLAKDFTHGFCIFPPRKGMLEVLPEFCPLTLTVAYKKAGKSGVYYGGGKNSIDCVATAIVTGTSEEECASAVVDTAKWFESNVVWNNIN